MTKKIAFTLAEVLITLSIIGIVAAFTMPTLIQKYKRLETSSKLKKFYSTLMQAYIYVENEKGITMENWVFNDISSGSNADRAEEYYYTFFDNNYFKVISVERGLWPGSSYRECLEVIFADGSIMYLWAGNAIDILYDVNGKKSPNVEGRDCFKFMHYPKQRLKPYIVSGNSLGTIKTREDALNVCIQFPTDCMPLIMNYDGFEFKDDYPYKL